MVTVAIGAALGGIAYASFTTAAAFSTMALFNAIMIGASIGSMFLQTGTDYDNSPTYSMGEIHNTKTQNLPVPIVYGGEMMVAGNIIYQAFDSDEKKVQTLYVLLSEGEIQDVNYVKANDQLITDLPDCSQTIHTITTSNTHDSRDPSGTRPYPNNVALICMTLTASEKLSGSPTITSIVKGVKVWTPNGKLWTTNPIWCAIDLLANPRYGMGLCTYDNNGNYDHPDWDKIDYSYAVQAANYCDGLIDGDKRFELTYIVDTQRAIKDVLQDMLQTCRGYTVENEKIEFHIETAVNNVSHAITENNIIQGSFTWWQKTDSDMANQISLTWTDPSNSYDQVTDVYQNDPDIADRGLVTQSYTMVGITKQSQANRMGYYLLKTNLLVRNLCSFRVGIKDIDIRPGQVISVSFPSFTGWNNKWFRVISTKIENETEMTVVCGEYIADCYNDSSIAVVAHIDTQRTKSYTPQEVTNLTVTEEITVAEDGQYVNTAIANWTPSSYANSVEVWYRFDNDAYYTMAATLSQGSTEFRLDCTTHSVVYFKIITVSSIGIHSSGVVVRHAITGDVTPPATCTNLTATGGYKLANLKWTDPSDADLDHVDVYRSSNGINYAVAGRSFRGEQAFIDTNLGILTNYWYKLKAVDSAGNESVFSAVTQAQTTAIPPADIPDYSIDGHKTVTDIFGDNEKTAEAVIEQTLNNYNDNKQTSVRITEAMEIIDDVTGRWYVKIDNNHRVAGLSLYNGVEESNFTVLADKFFIYGNGTGGSELKQVFAVDTTTGKVVLYGDLLADGSITGAKINAAAQIALGDGGELVMGQGSVLQMASGAVVLDSEAGTLQIRDANNLVTGDYIRIETGNIVTYKYYNGQYRPERQLSKVESGTVANGTTVTLEGYYDQFPAIQLSPASLQSYNKDYSTQNQTIVLSVQNPTINNNRVSFTAKATLAIAGGSTRVTTPIKYYVANQQNKQHTISYTLNIPQNAVNVRVKLRVSTVHWSYADTVFWGGQDELYVVNNERKCSISMSDGSTTTIPVTNSSMPLWFIQTTYTGEDGIGSEVGVSKPFYAPMLNKTRGAGAGDATGDITLDTWDATTQSIVSYVGGNGWYRIENGYRNTSRFQLYSDGSDGGYLHTIRGVTQRWYCDSGMYNEYNLTFDRVSGANGLTITVTTNNTNSGTTGYAQICRISDVSYPYGKAEYKIYQQTLNQSGTGIYIVEYSYELTGSTELATGTVNYLTIA